MTTQVILQQPAALPMADRLTRIVGLAYEANAAMEHLLRTESENTRAVLLEELDQALAEMLGLIAGREATRLMADLIEFVQACYGGRA